MKLLKVTIACFDKKRDSIIGESYESGIFGRAIIDLDKLTSYWENPDGELCVHLSGGESYMIYQISFDDFLRELER